MIGLISRLFFLQIKENKKYLTLSDKNRIREWKLAPERGEFHDYFGKVIAGNFESYQLHVIPEQVEDFRYVIYYYWRINHSPIFKHSQPLISFSIF